MPATPLTRDTARALMPYPDTGVARSPLRAVEKLSIRVDQQLRDMQKNRRLVRSFFDALSVAYISDC